MRRVLFALALPLLLALSGCGGMGLMTPGGATSMFSALQQPGIQNPLLQQFLASQNVSAAPATPANTIATLTRQVQAQQREALKMIESYNETISAFAALAASLKPIEVGSED